MSQSSMGLLHSPAARTIKLPIHEKSTTLRTCCTNYYLLTNNLKDSQFTMLKRSYIRRFKKVEMGNKYTQILRIPINSQLSGSHHR
jgi:hypothetical protein